MKWWKYLILILVLVAVMPFVLADDWKNLYTQNASFITFQSMNGSGIYNWTDNNDTLNWLMKFDDIWANGFYVNYPVNETWVDNLHNYGGRHRRLIFYEFFPSLHFIGEYDNPDEWEQWKVDFLDEHINDFSILHPRYWPYTAGTFTLGKFCNLCNWKDYFINYGHDVADRNLTHQYYDVRRTDWDYDGIFFDLTGSFFTNLGGINDSLNASKIWNPITRYNWGVYADDRDNASMTYDENARAFLEKLREKNTSTTDFPIWVNQAYRSNFSGNQNEYYKVINADVAESMFTSYRNDDGWVENVSVMVDGVWYNNSNPVETKIINFSVGLINLQPLLLQATYAKNNYGNTVAGKIFNTIRPYYDPIDGGYNATVDREAIYYSHGVGKLTGVVSYARDNFDTLRNKTLITAPIYTGLPLFTWYKWAKDDIYFLDLGDYEPGSYETYDLGGGKQARVRWFTKGIVIVNSANPAQDICVNLSDNEYLKNQSHGVFWYYNNFNEGYQSANSKTFCVPAAYRPLEDAYKNSARFFSYLDESAKLMTPACGQYLAYYTFEDNSTEDVSRDNDGTNHGATFVDGKYGEGLDFDGNDYVDVPDSSDLDITDKITISLWVKGNSSSNLNTRYAIGKTRAYALQVSTTSGSEVIFRIRNSSNNAWNSLATGADVLDDDWHQVVASYDGDKMRVYVDDNLVATSDSIGDTIYASNYNLTIGAYSSNYYYFNGSVDGVSILDCVS